MTSSMGRIVPYMKWKIKNVPNHQPDRDFWDYQKIGMKHQGSLWGLRRPVGQWIA